MRGGVPFRTRAAQRTGEVGPRVVFFFVFVAVVFARGRSGVVAACLLGLALGLPAARALEETQARHDARDDPAWPLDQPQPSPQTDIQRVQVEMLLEALVAEDARMLS